MMSQILVGWHEGSLFQKGSIVMRYHFVTLLLILSFSQLPCQDKNMKIDFIGMEDGCPNTPKMWASLQEALHELHWKTAIDSLDLIDLSRKEDARAGYGSPTILVNGRDLFDVSPAKSFNPACRFYRGGVPGTKDIAAKLKSLRP